MSIYAIQGRELEALREALQDPNLHTLRIGIDGDDLKIKFNGGIWSPPVAQKEN